MITLIRLILVVYIFVLTKSSYEDSSDPADYAEFKAVYMYEYVSVIIA